MAGASMIAYIIFTFQYVSINTDYKEDGSMGQVTLHSNMFLLILGSLAGSAAGLLFTFQYVSINTVMCARYNHTYQPLHSNMFLLIRD